MLRTVTVAVVTLAAAIAWYDSRPRPAKGSPERSSPAAFPAPPVTTVAERGAGNHPQVFSHAGLVHAALVLDRSR